MAELVIVSSDHHAGGITALCPPTVALIDKGGSYRANSIQRHIWRWWTNGFIDGIAALIDTHKPTTIYNIINGDPVEGNHHDSAELVSSDIRTQAQIAIDVFEPLYKKISVDFTFCIDGTQAHGGPNNTWEKFLADDFGAVPNDETGSPTWHWLYLTVSGITFDIAHHGKGSHLSHRRGFGALSMAADLTTDYLESGDKLPDIAIRSHTHVKGDSADNYKIRVISIPGWQFPTRFINRLSPGKLPTIGGIAILCDNGDYQVFKFYKDFKRRRPWQRK